ncbi:PAQR family membrane homeostasis protein TrhA [Cyclobacterium plantarum]|uniref:Hemolysin III family protein n=1 Tax=Cyclobacterium plantarum TaxID=2716263 RepID=A0ABX0H673_9BACT|nr:hemolysin III family protein [Cyclobacterium plantarum]NHE55922.1 hemolysin III family protein [Cyclobacterium plantarum]
MDGSGERKQSLKEEFANSITHLIGILFSIVAIALLVVFSVMNGTLIHVLSCSIFGGTILLMYTFSTLYHAISSETIKPLLRTFDHISIYFLIAGTYSPFLLIGLGGTSGWVYFGIIWGLTLIGLVFKIYFTHRFSKLSLVLYLSMGWMLLFFIRPLMANLTQDIIILMAAGGLAYTTGVIFYANKKMRYAHAIWHLFVLAGTVFHFIAIMLMIS